MLRSLKAADKNTNERSQVENVSTVVLIDLTDTSSVPQWRELVARLSAKLQSGALFFVIWVFYFSGVTFRIPTLNIASTVLSPVHKFI